MTDTRITLREPILTARANGIDYSVAFDRYDGDRVQYAYNIALDGETIADGEDLRSGSGDDVNLADMLGTLLDFLEAFLEACEYERRTGRRSENSDLFPDACRALDSDDVSEVRMLIGDDNV
jgi:hypothetical protein